MSDRKSFILHKDSLSVLDDLSDEQAGRLFKAIRAHQCGIDIEIDAITKIALSPFKSQFDRDDEKYEKKVNANKINGMKGGRPKSEGNPEKAKEPSGLFGNPENPQKGDSGSDSGSDSDSEDIDTNVSSSTDVDRCPQSEIISIWGEVLPELRQPRVWDGQRAKDLAARWKSKDVKANSVDYWRGLFEYIRRSDFLMGRVTNFSASLDWVVKASNYNKIIEGKYHE